MRALPDRRNVPNPSASIVCPACGVMAVETLPDDRCLYFWECPACGTLVRPLPGDCCVFCSYGEQRCPPSLRQQE